MKLSIWPTATIVKLNGHDARVWEGVDEHNTPVTCFISRVAVDTSVPAEAQARFDRELKETSVPQASVAWPGRMLID